MTQIENTQAVENTDQVVVMSRPTFTLSAAAEACQVSKSKIRRMLDATDEAGKFEYFPNRFRAGAGGTNDPWMLTIEDLMGAGLRPHAPTSPEVVAGSTTSGDVVIDLRDGRDSVDVEKILLQAEVRRLTDLNGSKDLTIEAAMLALRALPPGAANAGVTPQPSQQDPLADTPKTSKPRRRWGRRAVVETEQPDR